jgi:hypothetical protein
LLPGNHLLIGQLPQYGLVEFAASRSPEQTPKVRKVGLGFIHDSAYVEIQFDHLVTATGQVLPFAGEVVEVDNAREAVRHGVFRGIRATNRSIHILTRV